MSNELDRLTEALAKRYAIEREIGQGGMATVYLARDLRHDRPVAIKVLRPDLAAVIGADRFLAEIKTTANLQHRHILPLFDSGEADGLLFYVMPYVEGESLREKLDRERQLPIEEAIRIATETADALEHAHRRGLIHRDIKPANILLQEGHVLVADFGIALAVSSAGGARLTETGLSVGTPQYMSPEQAAGETTVDARSDQYSLACVLYEMLVGEPAHTGPTAQAIIAKVITEDPPSLSDQRKTVPVHVEYAVLRGLSKLPADRFGSAAEFSGALANTALIGTWPGISSMAGAPDPWLRWIGRRRWLGWAIPLLLVVLVGVASWGWLRATSASSARAAASLRFSIPYEIGESFFANRDAIGLSPAGGHIAFVAGADEDTQFLYLRPLGQLESAQVADSKGALDPFFSPDGRWVGFATVTGIRRSPISGGSTVDIVEFPEPRGVSWGPEDDIVFGSTSGLWRVPAEGGEPVQLTRLDPDRGETLHSRPSFLPDGEAVLFTIGRGNLDQTEVAILTLSTGDVVRLFPGLSPRYAENGHLLYGSADGALIGIPFDAARRETVGQSMRLIEGVAVKTTGTVEFEIARNGTLVYLTGEPRDAAIVTVDRGGIEDTLIADRDRYANPRFSPDGRRLAFGRGLPPTRQIWVYEMSDGTSMPLTFEGHHYYPVWSPDGSGVAFTTETPEGAGHLSWTEADGSGEITTLFESGDLFYPASWSRDGVQLVFRRQDVASRRDLWRLTLGADTTAAAIFELPSNEDAAALSPDGNWLAYVSDLSGQAEVYVSRFPDAAGRRTVSLDGGTEPMWSRDGTELFYWTGEGLVAARIRTNPEFEVTRRTVLFTGPYQQWPFHAAYDVHPDGDRFVFVRGGESPPSQLVVVANWFAEFGGDR
jgi:serine/threonine-protein kinase